MVLRLLRYALIPVLLLAAANKDEWTTYAHDPSGQRFSPLNQINRTNVSRLHVAWTFRTGDIYMPAHGAPRRLKGRRSLSMAHFICQRLLVASSRSIR